MYLYIIWGQQLQANYKVNMTVFEGGTWQSQIPIAFENKTQIAIPRDNTFFYDYLCYSGFAILSVNKTTKLTSMLDIT